jgi:hypothetical protein
VREPPFKPFALGRYRCDDRLRAGGIGDLYLGVHLPSGSRCTLWSVCPELLDDAETAEQLLQVQLRVQMLNHPNIISVREILRHETEIYVVMDYFPGVSLRQVLQRLREVGPFSPAAASFVVWQICQALDHAHHLKSDGRPAPLIHGALWPQNVTVSFKGEVRLLDFGTWLIPRAAYGDDDVSVRTHFSYRAPEHVTGETLTRSTDLFCVGILLYEMLSGRPLFLGKTLMETVQRVERGDLGPMSAVPANLQPVLRRCMAIEPRDRYADVAAFIAELSLVVAGVGDRAVRQELVRFLGGHFAPRPLAAAQPAPLPGQEDDETTGINPADLAQVLIALSRERTDPGKQARRQQNAPPPRPAAIITTITDDEGGEKTRVDTLRPEPLDDGPTPTELGDDASTVQDASIERPPVMARVKASPSPAPGPRPAPAALFPPSEEDARRTSGPLKEYATDETTGQASRSEMGELMGEEEPTTAMGTRLDASDEETTGTNLGPDMGEEEPTVTRPQASDHDELPTIRVSPAPDGSVEEMPTLNEKPQSDPGARPRELASEIARTPFPAPDPPRRASRPPPPRPSGLRKPVESPARAQTLPENALVGPRPGVGGTLPPIQRDDSLPDHLSSVPAHEGADGQQGLYFEKSGVHEVEEAEPPSMAMPVYEPNEGTPLSAFDPDAFSRSYSQSYEAHQKKSKLSLAHVMLAVAVLVFLVAVAMLVRRLVSQPATGPALPARADARAAVRPDARPKRATKRDTGAQEPRPTGKEYDDLLKGKLPAGELRIDSTPTKARLYVGRMLHGVTPLTLRLKAGRAVEVALVAPGYSILRKKIDLPRERGLTINEKLVKSPYPRKIKGAWGTLHVRCHGDDLHLRRVIVDDEDTGSTCDRLDLRLAVGVHRVKLVSLESDKTPQYNLRIKKKKHAYLSVGKKKLKKKKKKKTR